MEKGTSKGDDNQRGRSAKGKNTATDQTDADNADVSSAPPSRVHIFKGKPFPGVSSKSDGEQLEFSPFRANTPAHSGQRAVQAPILVEAHPPTVNVKNETTRLKGRIEKGKKAVWKIAMKAEDLQGMRQTLQRTRDRIFKTRK